MKGKGEGMKKLKPHADEYANKAISGLTTAGLLEILHGASGESLAQFQNAHVVTLNIGGNNILVPFLEHLSGLAPAEGADAMAGAIALFEAWQAVGNIVAGTDENSETGIGQMLPGLVDAFFGLRGLFAARAEIRPNLAGAVSILMGSFPPELEAALEEGAQAFIDDFDEIIAWLGENAPNAFVIVNTVYNPLPREVAGFYASIAHLADGHINKMNEAIIGRSGAMGFAVADLFSFFDERLDLMRLNLDIRSDDFSFDIIHPSAEGHLIIAELHYGYFARYR